MKNLLRKVQRMMANLGNAYDSYVRIWQGKNMTFDKVRNFVCRQTRVQLVSLVLTWPVKYCRATD